MKSNMGTADRAIRVLVAICIAALYFMGKLSGTLALVLEVIAVAFIVTSLIGWCPLYMPFGISTRRSGGPPAA